MTKERADGHELVRLSDSNLRLEEPEQDIRGLDVYARDGDHIGSVEDLYVDTEERKVRFPEVGAGGFLGIGEKRFMIPVEAVADVGKDGVTIEHGREKVTGSPPSTPTWCPPQPITSARYMATTATRPPGHPTDPVASERSRKVELTRAGVLFWAPALTSS